MTATAADRERRRDGAPPRRSGCGSAASAGSSTAIVVFAVLLLVVDLISAGAAQLFRRELPVERRRHAGARRDRPDHRHPLRRLRPLGRRRRSRWSTSSWRPRMDPTDFEASVAAVDRGRHRHRHAGRRLQRLLHRLPPAAADRRHAVDHVHRPGRHAARPRQARRLRLALARRVLSRRRHPEPPADADRPPRRGRLLLAAG